MMDLMTTKPQRLATLVALMIGFSSLSAHAADDVYLPGVEESAQDAFRAGLAAALKKLPKCNPYRLLESGVCCPPGLVSLGKGCARIAPGTCANVAIDNPQACQLKQCAKYVLAKGKMVPRPEKACVGGAKKGKSCVIARDCPKSKCELTGKNSCKKDEEGKPVAKKDEEGNPIEGQCVVEMTVQEVPCEPWNDGVRDLNCVLDTYECTKQELASGPTRWCGDWMKQIVVPPEPGPDGKPVAGAKPQTKHLRCKPSEEGCSLAVRECMGKELLSNRSDGAGPCRIGEYMDGTSGKCTAMSCPRHCRANDGRCSNCGPDYLGAAGYFKTAAGRDKRFYEAYFNWAMALERLGKYDEALVVYEKAKGISAKGGRERKLQLQAQAFIARVRLGQAHRLNEAGALEKAKGLSEQARGICESIRGQDPDNVVANATLAQYWFDKNNMELAERFVRQVLRVNREDTVALNIRGLINLHNNQDQIARWILEAKVLKLDPANPEALANLGLAYVRLKNLPLAVVAFERSVKIKPNSVPARLNLGAIYIEYLNYKQAHAQYGAALKLEPDNLEALTGFALAQEGMRRPDKAAKLYERVLAKDAGRHALLVRLALIYEKAPFNDGKKAVVYWKRYKSAVGLPDGKAAKLDREAVKLALDAHKKKRSPRKKSKKAAFVAERAKLKVDHERKSVLYKNVLAIESRIFAIVQGMKMAEEARKEDEAEE
jgi:tetratricopeptide (TPR) repeat protein